MGGGEINLQIGHPRELIIVLSGNFVACVFLRRRTTNTISSEEGEGSILIRAKLIHSGSLVAANSVSCRTGSVRPLSSAIRRQRYSITADQPWHQSCKAPLFRCRLSTIDCMTTAVHWENCHLLCQWLRTLECGKPPRFSLHGRIHCDRATRRMCGPVGILWRCRTVRNSVNERAGDKLHEYKSDCWYQQAQQLYC